MKRTHKEIAHDAVTVACSKAAQEARKAERVWWRQEIAKLLTPGEPVSPGALLRLSELRGK